MSVCEFKVCYKGGGCQSRDYSVYLNKVSSFHISYISYSLCEVIWRARILACSL